MANIKVSEMTEATSFDEGDYTMIIQANQNKKISKENILSDVEGDISTINNDISTINTNIGNLSNLATEDKTSVVNAINELKNAEIYSTDETKTNKVWINGKSIYRKVINCGNLPNASSITIAHNITNLQSYISVIGVAQRNTDNDLLPIPYVTFNANNSGGIMLNASSTAFNIATTTNRSAYVGYLILEYTKTTD